MLLIVCKLSFILYKYILTVFPASQLLAVVSGIQNSGFLTHSIFSSLYNL